MGQCKRIMGNIERNREVATAQKAKVQSQDYFMVVLTGGCLRT